MRALVDFSWLHLALGRPVSSSARGPALLFSGSWAAALFDPAATFYDPRPQSAVLPKGRGSLVYKYHFLSSALEAERRKWKKWAVLSRRTMC